MKVAYVFLISATAAAASTCNVVPKRHAFIPKTSGSGHAFLTKQTSCQQNEMPPLLLPPHLDPRRPVLPGPRRPVLSNQVHLKKKQSIASLLKKIKSVSEHPVSKLLDDNDDTDTQPTDEEIVEGAIVAFDEVVDYMEILADPELFQEWLFKGEDIYNGNAFTLQEYIDLRRKTAQELRPFEDIFEDISTWTGVGKVTAGSIAVVSGLAILGGLFSIATAGAGAPIMAGLTTSAASVIGTGTAVGAGAAAVSLTTQIIRWERNAHHANKMETVLEDLLEWDKKVMRFFEELHQSVQDFDEIFKELKSYDGLTKFWEYVGFSLEVGTTFLNPARVFLMDGSAMWQGFAAVRGVNAAIEMTALGSTVMVGTEGTITLAQNIAMLSGVEVEHLAAPAVGSVIQAGSKAAYGLQVFIGGVNTIFGTMDIIDGVLHIQKSTMKEQLITDIQDMESATTAIESMYQTAINPSLSREATALKLNTAGSFSIINFDVSSFTEEQTSEVMGYFEDAITVLMPPQSIVNIISIDNGVIQYEVVTYIHDHNESVAARASIELVLTEQSTLTSITNHILEASQASSDPAIRDTIESSIVHKSTVVGLHRGTTSMIIMAGQLTVDNFDSSSFDKDQIEEAKSYFESAITQELSSQGLLPQGSSALAVTSIANGVVVYEVLFFDAGYSMATNVGSALSNGTTLSSISDTVQAESSESTTGLSSSMSSVSITENTSIGN